MFEGCLFKAGDTPASPSSISEQPSIVEEDAPPSTGGRRSDAGADSSTTTSSARDALVQPLVEDDREQDERHEVHTTTTTTTTTVIRGEPAEDEVEGGGMEQTTTTTTTDLVRQGSRSPPSRENYPEVLSEALDDQRRQEDAGGERPESTEMPAEMYGDQQGGVHYTTTEYDEGEDRSPPLPGGDDVQTVRHEIIEPGEDGSERRVITETITVARQDKRAPEIEYGMPIEEDEPTSGREELLEMMGEQLAEYDKEQPSPIQEVPEEGSYSRFLISTTVLSSISFSYSSILPV